MTMIKTLSRAIGAGLLSLAIGMPTSVGAELLLDFKAGKIRDTRDLFPSSGEAFTNQKSTLPNNTKQIVIDPVLEQRVIRFHADPRRGGTVSKESVVYQGFSAGEGQRLTVALRLKLIGPSARGVYIIDVECTDCWPKGSSVPNKSPGIRLKIDPQSGRLTIDRGKIGYRRAPLKSTHGVPAFPIGKWVDLVWQIELSGKSKVQTSVTVDDDVLLQAKGFTLPQDSVFRGYGIKLEKFRYDYVEIGLTANESSNPQSMLVSWVQVWLD